MILPVMFCLGVFATMAQVLFMRETLVVFFGNELSIGVILASWLLGIGLGALAVRFPQKRLVSAAGRQQLLVGLLVILSAVLPLQIYFVRIVRSVLHVPMGEYASLAAVFSGSLLIFLPTSFSIGAFFPLACTLFQERTGEKAAAAVSPVYMLESLGSMTGGAILTYMLLPAMTPYRIVLLASAIVLVAAALLAVTRGFRVLFAGVAICLAVGAAVYPRWMTGLERRTVEARWRAFGILQPGSPDGSPAVRLVADTDTVYQNLAVTESASQYVLYANGQVVFAFPDPGASEHSIHFIMAQNPRARRVLLLGGNPAGDIPELLKYRVERLVYVTLDQGVDKLLVAIVPEQYMMKSWIAAKKVEYVYEDAPRYVQRCREQFDVILVNAPEPVTVGANRYYTLEFCRSLRNILAPNGFIYTAVSSSERLQSEAADLGASVYRTLKQVFPVVLVTAETRNRFFAGGPGAGLTFNRALLTGRSEAAAIPTRFFRPEWFGAADEIDEEKTREVERKLSARQVPLNTNLRPVTCFFNLFLWSHFSGSRVDSLLGSLGSLDPLILIKWFLVVGLVLFLVGVVLRGLRPASAQEPRAWPRFMLGLVMLTTGLCGMALEMALIFVFQGLYGYVYARMGLIVAAFMLGLVLGAPCGRLMAGGRQSWAWAGLAGIEFVLLACALAVPRLAELATDAGGFEVLIYAAVVIVGWGVGAEFPVANRLYCDAGGTLWTASAITDGADHIGAAAGALIMGVMLVPVLGLAASCAVLAALKMAGLLFVASALLTLSGPIRRE